MIRKLIQQNNLSKAEKQNANKLRVQQVSCLYSDHIYKTKSKELDTNIKKEKYKNLYEHQRLQKLTILKELEKSKALVSSIGIEKEILKFALKASKNKNAVNYDQKMMQERQKKKALLKQLMKKKENTNSNSPKIKMSQTIQYQKLNESSLKRIATYHNIEGPKQLKENNFVSMRKVQKEKQSPRAVQVPSLSEQDDFSVNDSHCSQVQQLLAEKDKTIELLQQKVQEQTKQLEQYENDKIKITKLQDLVAELYKNIENFQQNEQVLKLQIQREKNHKNKIILQLQNVKKQYEERQKKEEIQIQALKQFTEKLSISDKKIKQFIKQELQQINQISQQALPTFRLAINEKISYLLHLNNKKQELFSNLVSDLKKQYENNQIRYQLLEKKYIQCMKVHERLKEFAKMGMKDQIYDYYATSTLFT